MKRRNFGHLLCSCLALGFLWRSVAFAGAFEYRLPDRGTVPDTWNTLVGFMQVHTVGKNETLLDIARLYGLGFNEIELLTPGPTRGSLSPEAKWPSPQSGFSLQRHIKGS